jgi:hypothetical protein
VSAVARPLYSRALRLHHIRPGPILRLIYLEGAVGLAGLAALAELASWWSILVLPAVVGALVKAEDVATGYRRARASATPWPSVVTDAPATPVPVGQARPAGVLTQPFAGSAWSPSQAVPARNPGAHRALAEPVRAWGRAAVPQPATRPPHTSQR